MQLPDDSEDLSHQNGGKAHRGLVQHQQLGVADQRPAHSQHLLLAAGERPRHLIPPLLQAGEAGEDILQLLTGGLFVKVGPHLQVLQHRHLLEDTAALRHVGQPLICQIVAGGVGDVLPQKLDAAGTGVHHAGDGFQGGGFSGAVGADQGHHLAGAHLEGDVLQCMDLAVVDVDILNLQHRPWLLSSPDTPR